jgi:hypothetical protein
MGPTPPPAGFYHMQVQGSAADVYHALELDLAVQDFALAQPPDLTQSVNTPSVTVPISFTRLPAEAPFNGDVTFTVFTPATFYFGTFTPNPVANPGTTTTLALTAGAAATGTYPVTVTGTEQATGISHQVTFNITLR